MEDRDFLIHFTEHYDSARDYAWIECRPKSKEDAKETFQPFNRLSRLCTHLYAPQCATLNNTDICCAFGRK